LGKDREEKLEKALDKLMARRKVSQSESRRHLRKVQGRRRLMIERLRKKERPGKDGSKISFERHRDLPPGRVQDGRTISVSSDETAGTTFTLQLPRG
jgi:hypothetical protein